MDNAIFNDFVVYSEFPIDVIEKYHTVVPAGIVDIWKQLGLGVFKNGFIKIINPDEYRKILDVSYANSVSIPLFATGMGDIITWVDNHSFILVNFEKKVLHGLGKSVKVLLLSLDDDEFCEYRLFWKNYPSAVAAYGPLAYDECFGYVPLLGLGGTENVENLQKVNIKEQILIITELLGSFE